jgi:ketosteroid isomerase-like protein
MLAWSVRSIEIPPAEVRASAETIIPTRDRMLIARVGLPLAIAALLAAAPARAQQPAPAPLPSATLPPEVERVLRDYERAWAAGDEDALAGLFSEDGFVLQNGHLPVRGRADIRQAYAQGGGPLRLRALGYAVDGNVGYIIGAYGYGADRAEVGKFILALRRAPGGPWMIAADMDNMNQMPRRPPPPPAP